MSAPRPMVVAYPLGRGFITLPASGRHYQVLGDPHKAG